MDLELTLIRKVKFMWNNLCFNKRRFGLLLKPLSIEKYETITKYERQA